MSDVRATRLLDGLDANQRAAVTTDAAPLAIIAAAGSGKTTVLTRRIAYRMYTGSADANHVVALTFTRDAAGELKRRLRRLDIRTPIEAGTFHAVCLRLLRDRALAANQPMPQVASDRGRLIRECMTELRLNVEPYAAGADIDWARARMVSPDRYESACRAVRRRTSVPPNKLGALLDAYSSLKRRRGVLDFDDLLERTQQAAQDEQSFRDLVQWRFRHFFIDEAQDLNPLQHSVLESWRAGRPDICLVGDPRQAIYGWNGADPTLFEQVEQQYPAITVIRLNSNYRCSPQVVRAAAAALTPTDQSDDTLSQQPDGPPIDTASYPSDHIEAQEVAKRVASYSRQRSLSDVAVLARTNEQLSGLDRELTARGITVERASGRSPVEVALASAYRAGGRESLAVWVDEAFSDSDPVKRRVSEEADRFLSSSATGGFRAWVESRNPFDDLTVDSNSDAVSLLTFHAAKGREWPVVFVTGIEKGLVPHSSAVTPAQMGEEARLLYVAITRAADHIHLSSAEMRRNSPSGASPWLRAVAETSTTDIAMSAPASVDLPRHTPDPMAALVQWRHGIARMSGTTDNAVCTNRTLRALLDDPPQDLTDLAKRLGISTAAAQRLKPLPTAEVAAEAEAGTAINTSTR